MASTVRARIEGRMWHSHYGVFRATGVLETLSVLRRLNNVLWLMCVSVES